MRHYNETNIGLVYNDSNIQLFLSALVQTIAESIIITLLIVPYTVVWKIFIWNYFVVENVRENNFRGLPIPMKIF